MARRGQMQELERGKPSESYEARFPPVRFGATRNVASCRWQQGRGGRCAKCVRGVFFFTYSLDPADKTRTVTTIWNTILVVVDLNFHHPLLVGGGRVQLITVPLVGYFTRLTIITYLRIANGSPL